MPPASHALLLTACIAPKGPATPFFRRADPAVRLADYASTLRFWLRLRDPRIGAIVFADNSGHPLDSLRALAAAEATPGLPVEFLSFDFPAPPPELSYGHPEMLLVNAALDASPALARLPFFAKVTGRYRYPGFPRLLDRLPPAYRVAVDTTGVRPWPWHRRSRPISGFGLALFRTEFYHARLRAIPGLMRPAPPWSRLQFVEAMIHDALLPLRHEPGVILRWPCNCEPVGIGANGEDYGSLRRRAAAFLRALSRRLAPGLWI